MKKLVSAILTLAILAIPCSIPLTAMAATEAPAPDYAVAQNWPGADQENYWGPYGNFEDLTTAGGALVFDQSKSDVNYITLNFKDYGKDTTTYKYLEIEMKSSLPTGGNAQLSIGQTAAGTQNGKPVGEWVLADGSKLALTDAYQTFKIDLAANGTTQFFAGTNPAFALNKLGTDTISIKSIKLTSGTTTVTESQPASSSSSQPASSASSTQPAAASKDYIIGDAWARVVGDKPTTENYWGPYGNFDLATTPGTLLWYADDSTSYGTMGFFWDTYDHTNGYKYMVLVAKTDDPAACDVQMSIGQDAKNKQVGKAFSDWTLANGKTGAKLTSEYKTYVIDLKASGVTQFFVQGKPDFAFNADKHSGYMISIDKMYLTNTAPAADNSSASTVPASASSTASPSSSSSVPKTGDTAGIAAPFVIVMLCASASVLFLLRAKKKKEI